MHHRYHPKVESDLSQVMKRLERINKSEELLDKMLF